MRAGYRNYARLSIDQCYKRRVQQLKTDSKWQVNMTEIHLKGPMKLWGNIFHLEL